MVKREAPKAAAAPSPIKSPFAMPVAETTASWPDTPQPQQQTEANAVESGEPPALNTAAPALEEVPLPPARLQWAAVKANCGPIIAGLGPRALSGCRGGALL